VTKLVKKKKLLFLGLLRQGVGLSSKIY
jgi:hypothetical protein